MKRRYIRYVGPRSDISRSPLFVDVRAAQALIDTGDFAFTESRWHRFVSFVRNAWHDAMIERHNYNHFRE